MPYFTITDFAAGLDLRRASLTAPAGTLRMLTNAHVTPGGEIEKRYAFVNFKTLPPESRGLVEVNQRLYTFVPMTAAQIAAINPTARVNSHAYSVGATIVVASNPSRLFTCTTAGTTAATEPAGYAGATNTTPIADGTAVFVASTPPGWTTDVEAPAYVTRANNHDYGADTITVTSNPTMIFTCSKVGTSADFEPAAYATASDGAVITDGTAAFVAHTQDVPLRINGTAYAVDVITVATNPTRRFVCMQSGTSAAAEPAEYATAENNTQVLDGTAVFLATTTEARVNSRGYAIDATITVASNPTRVFTCTTAGAAAAAEPAAYATAVDGTSVTDGVAVFRAGKASTTRANSHAYVVDTIRLANNSSRLFSCVEPGTSASTLPTAYAAAGDNALVNDGTALFLAGISIYAPRIDNHAYIADTIRVASNPTRIFTCTTTLGLSAPSEPAAYATAVDGTVVTDGTATFVASTPLADWIIKAQPAIVPTKTEPVGIWDVGLMPLETTSLFEIVDYDLFDNKVFVVAWIDNIDNVVRCYDGKSVPSAQGFFVKTYKTKVFSVGGSVLYFSSIANPADWTGTGSGSIDLSLEDSDMTDCVAVEVYYDKLAIFSKTAVQLWVIDPDPLKNQYVQTLRDAGTVAWRSVLQYGSGDIMYLAPSGVRSLRARNSSLAAAVSDIGSPIDPVLQAMFRTRSEEFFAGTMSLLAPVTGRFWVIMPDRIYVLSAFPGPKVTAWSLYEPTAPVDVDGVQTQVLFRITAATVYQHRVVARDENHNVYAYSGTDEAGPVYDDSSVELVFPFHAGDQPATYKTFQALDAACTGQWEVSIAINPDLDDAEDFCGILTGQTFTKGDFPITGRATHMSLRLRQFLPEGATLSNLIVHYQLGANRGIGL